MTKENLETKAKKAVLKIEDKVTDIHNVLYDISSKLCHIIKSYREIHGYSGNKATYK